MEIGAVQPVDIDVEMRTAYLDYAMSVIVARALPDARDGLKPVHRRILFGMHEMGVRSNTAYKKSARIVGDVLGKYHPHGDMAVYDAMARMAQDFSMRYMLVDGQGNFGSVDGDAPAAMRYTEARLSAMAEEMLLDIDKQTVNFVDNFDGSMQEPTVLPSRLPNLLLNGSSGIAVGMTTNVPPHNLRELCAALIYLIDNYDDIEEIDVKDLMEYLPGPDFPTGGKIIGSEGILQAYSTGRGRLVMRGKAHFETNGRNVIVITEIPYQVNKSSMIERIAELVRDGRLDAISDLRDESDRRGMRIVIELKRGNQPELVLNQLYKFTTLQSTFGVQMRALVNNEPHLLPLKELLQHHLSHRQEIIIRRSEFELEKARNRAHILDGLLIALTNLDDVIQTIRQSADADQAKTRLIKRFKLGELQAQAILDMQLRRLAALERQKIEDEHREVLARITYLEDLLAHPKKILGLIKDDLNELNEKYGDQWRTVITAGEGEDPRLLVKGLVEIYGEGWQKRVSSQEQEEFHEEDMVADEAVIISITQRGLIKRVNLRQYSGAGEGRRGVSAQVLKEEDGVLMLVPARTLQSILFFSDRGKVYSQKAREIPEGNRAAPGKPVSEVFPVEEGERITTAVAVPSFETYQYCILATVQGRVKRMQLSELSSVRVTGIMAMQLEKGDELGWARLTRGEDEVILVSAHGQALRLAEKVMRPMGRQAGGTAGIRLDKDDQVVSLEVVEPGAELLVVTVKGYGKRSPIKEYPVKGRATSGVASIDQKNLPKIGPVAAARMVQKGDDVIIITGGGMVLRLKAKDVVSTGRARRGEHLMDVAASDQVASIARLAAGEQ